MSETIEGVIHGKTIELSADPGLADGQRVEVRVRVLETSQPWGEGLRRCAGAFADDPEFESVMAEVQAYREAATYREAPE